MSGANKYAIASQGLILVGHPAIASFDGPSSGQIVAGALYDGVRDELLGTHRWGFNKRPVQLARLPDPPLTEWDAAYQLPADTDLIYAVQVNGKDIEFDRYDNEIHCNASASDVVVLIKGLGASEERWPSYFIAVMRLKLASAFAIPVAEDTDKASIYEGKALRALTQAKLLDSQSHTAYKVDAGGLRRYHGGRP